MSRRKKNSPKRPFRLTKKKSKTSLTVSKNRYPVRSYEAYHEKFPNWDEIKNFLLKMQKSCPSIIQVQVIGQSARGRPIYMAVISEGESATKPKIGTMIVGGANGTEWFTVSSSLYIIEHLVKGRNLIKIMDYYVIPCCNPDIYECSLKYKGEEIKALDLTTNFPFSLGVFDFSDISNVEFFKAIQIWKDNFKFDCPERTTIMKTILQHQVAIKLFISLQGNGNHIAYPFGFTSGSVYDVEELKQVAKAGQNGVKGRCFEIGSLFDLNGLQYGTMVDYIRMCFGSIKFVYAIHVNRREKVLNPCKILSYGKDVMECIRFMAKNVYMICNKTEIDNCDDFFTLIWLCNTKK